MNSHEFIHTIYRDREECSQLPGPAAWLTPTRLAFLGGGCTVAVVGALAYGLKLLFPICTTGPCP